MDNALIKAGWILTMDDAMAVLRDGYVLVEGGRIRAVGEGEAPAAGQVIDLGDAILLPGFVNAHCHASMVPFRTMGDDCPDRLRRFLFPLENQAMTKELVYLSALYAMGEMLLSGTTTLVDMYYFEEQVARAALLSHMRAYLGETVIGQPTCAGGPYAAFDRQMELLDSCKGQPRLRPILAPHGTTTCDGASLVRAHDLAARYDTFMTVHVSEMDYEMRHFEEMGTTPVGYLRDLGVLDDRLLAAHAIHLTDSDIHLLSGSGAKVAHCIGSNTKAGKGVAPVKALLERHVPVGLGTDGPASGNTLSMFDQMRPFALFHKTENRDRSLFPASEIVRLATRWGAQALAGPDAPYGMIAPGMEADLAAVDVGAPSLFPLYNPYSALVYGAHGSDVCFVMAGGRVVVRDKQLTIFDMGALRHELGRAMGPFQAAARQYRRMI